MTPRTRGFTLIEVLVALLIVAFGMAAVLTALTSAAESTVRLREKTFAEWVGFNQLASVRLQATLPAAGEKDGDVEFADSRWHWHQAVENMDVPGLKRITIRVRHADGGRDGPAQSEGSTASDTWLATVIGFRGDALQSPLNVLSSWDGAGGLQPSPLPGG